MKADRNISKKGKRLESPTVEPSKQPAPEANEEIEDELAPWQKEIVALARAYLSIDDEQDLVPRILRRAIGICTVVEVMASGDSCNEISEEGIVAVMQLAQEQLQVAKWITSGKPLNSHWS
jgi:tRNA A37 N6-isopentenylltransferase MiaA